jgi:PAS domain S-box-containing protein
MSQSVRSRETKLRQVVEAERQAREAAEALTQRLSALEAVNMVLLQHQYQEDLIPALLTTVREVLHVDNVTLLLPTEDGTALARSVIRGPEKAVAEQVRVPIGQGIAGRIFQSGQPLIVLDLAASDAVNPFLREHLHSLLGVPLVIEGQTIGVLHVSTVQSRAFTEEDQHLLELVAQRVAIALDRIQTQEALQQARRQAEEKAAELEAIFAAISDAVFVIDAQGRVLRENPAVARLLRAYLPPEEAERRGRPVAIDATGQPIPDEDLPYWRALRGEIMSGPTAVDLRLRLPDGKIVDASLSGAPIRDASGQIVASVSIMRDVTERRRQERRTQETLDALLAMAQALAQPIGGPEDVTSIIQALLDIIRSVLSCQVVGLARVTPATETLQPVAIFGLSPPMEAVWWQEVPRSTLADYLEADGAASLRAGQIVSRDLVERPFANRSTYGIRQLVAAPVLAGDQLIGALGLEYHAGTHPYTAEDIALLQGVARLAAMLLDREQLAREREDARAQALALAETNRRMDTFVNLASHELRTPLTHFKGGVQLARHKLDRLIARQETIEPVQLAPIREILTQADRQTSRMNRLVNDLLEASRLQLDAITLRPETCDLVALVREAVEAQQLARPERIIRLEAPETPVPVEADADRIDQVVINYLVNAFKFAPPGRPITVTVQVEDPWARVAVRDEGPGVPPDKQEHIWERGYRVPGAALHNGSEIGLGLGLYLSRQLIEQHHGQVGVQSEPEKGATFWFTLPLHNSADR